MLPALIAAAGQAASSFFGGSDASGPLISGGGTFAPGGITIGSRVVGSGSAATTVPATALPVSATAVPGTATAAAGAVPFWQQPVVWIAGAGAVLLLLILFFRK